MHESHFHCLKVFDRFSFVAFVFCPHPFPPNITPPHPNTNLGQTHVNHIRVCVRVYSADKKLILLEPLSAPVWLFWMLLATAIVTNPSEKQTIAKKVTNLYV